MIKNKNVLRLTESAMMLAAASVLSYIKIFALPAGGSVTFASMLPIILIAYRYGTPWGLCCGGIYGVIQFVLGMKNLSYIPHTFVYLLIYTLADYLLAFTVLGLGGIFRGKLKSQSRELLCGAFVVSLLRYLCHVVAGATIWADLDVTTAGIVYSFVYNATYMIPEMLVLMIVTEYVGSVLDFRTPHLSALRRENENSAAKLVGMLAGLTFAAGSIAVISMVFSKLQNAETGEFAFEQLSQVQWSIVIVVAAITIAFTAALLVWRHSLRKKESAK